MACVRPSGPLALLSLSFVGAGILGAQALPGLPPVAPLAPRPDLSELLPLRPFAAFADPEDATPIQWRGEQVTEGPEGWVLEKGGVQSPEILLLADRIRYQPSTGILVAEGHIRMETVGLRLRCERLTMDWKRKVGEAWALELELPPNWVIRSSKVSFSSMKHWDFQSVELSPCPQVNPGWKAQASRLTVDLDRFATIRNLWIWVGNVPTPYYLPYAIYPAKAERSSGLLPVTVGMSFAGPTGASLGLPWYQVLGDWADATVGPEFFSKQGVLLGGELRWRPEATHEGQLQGEFIHQRSDGEKRYRVGIKELWQREDGWQFTADVNQASDTLVDSDYGKGVSNLGATSFDSAVYLGRNFPWASVSFSGAEQRSFFQPSDPFYRAEYASSLRKQTLPGVQGRLYSIPLGSFYFDAGMRLDRFAYRLELADDLTNQSYSWNREDIVTRLQGRLGQWGPFRADLQLGCRFTDYSRSLKASIYDSQAENASDNAGPGGNPAYSPFRVEEGGMHRFLGSMRLQFSGPQLGREFKDLKWRGWQGEIKHVLEPFFAFSGTTLTSGEGHVPRFDDVDSRPGVGGSAAGEESLELGMKHHLLGRPGSGSIFRDLVRWKASIRYHFRPIILDDGRYKHGWASLDNDFDAEPNEYVRVSFRQSSEVGASGADNSLSADFKAGDGGRLNLAYFSTGINRFLVRQRGVQFGGLQRLWDDRWRLEFKVNYDFSARTFAASQVALAYMTPCVSTSLRYSHVALAIPGPLSREDRLELYFTLRGLGDLFHF